MNELNEPTNSRTLPKCPTGITGLDDITGGGLPKGRPSLVCGNAGCGKTLMAIEFLVRGATQFNEPGVFMAFEETAKELNENVRSLGYDLEKLSSQKLLLLDHVYIERSEIEETGEYDLEGLFIRLNHAIDSIGAKRVVLDTIESLFAGLSNKMILRSELRRLFRWLKDKGVTAIITAEKGDGMLTAQGIEEYVSDCVILLDNRVTEQSSTRRLRILKYRGSTHGTNEYPFLIEEEGISVLPITSVGLNHIVSSERVSTGVERLDMMLDGKGYYRGSSILVSGTAGSGKSSLAAHFAVSTCQRQEKVLYFALEESPSQIKRNMLSIGIDLDQWEQKGLLKFYSSRPTDFGLESYLTTFHKQVALFQPSSIIIDPLSSFNMGHNDLEAKSMMIRLIDFLKLKGITAFLTNLSIGGSALEHTEMNISSLIDTWLLLRAIELGAERNRGLYILKSRGMAHSNQIREFLLTKNGMALLDVYASAEGVLTGSARVIQEAKDIAEKLQRQDEMLCKQMELDKKKRMVQLQIATLKAGFELEKQIALREIRIDQEKNGQKVKDKKKMNQKEIGDSNGNYTSLKNLKTLQ